MKVRLLTHGNEEPASTCSHYRWYRKSQTFDNGGNSLKMLLLHVNNKDDGCVISSMKQSSQVLTTMKDDSASKIRSGSKVDVTYHPNNYAPESETALSLASTVLRPGLQDTRPVNHVLPPQGVVDSSLINYTDVSKVTEKKRKRHNDHSKSGFRRPKGRGKMNTSLIQDQILECTESNKEDEKPSQSSRQIKRQNSKNESSHSEEHGIEFIPPSVVESKLGDDRKRSINRVIDGTEENSDHNPDISLFQMNIIELMKLLVDADAMRGFGWPGHSVEAVLGALLKKHGKMILTDDGHTSLTQRLLCSTKMLFSLIFDDQKVMEDLLARRSVQQILHKVVQSAKSSSNNVIEFFF